MITSAISSAVRLSLVPAKLAGQIAGALLRGLRGNGSTDRSSERRSGGAAPARSSRAQAQTKRSATRSSRAQAQTKRSATRSSGKRQPKRTAARARPKAEPSAARARPKAQPSAARPKRKAPGASAQARPKPAAGTEPLGDVAITREVESTIFQDIEAERGQVDVEVAEGVVRLRGEVRTPDLIRELELRAARVPRVRRVENLLRTPAPPPEPAPPAAEQVEPASTPEKTSGADSPEPAVRPTNLAAVAQGAVPPPAESTGVRAPRTGRWGEKAESPTETPEGTPQPTAGRPEGDAPAEEDEPGSA